MKKLFFLATCMLISFYIQAQDESAAALKALDSMLVNIDQTSVKTGIIYERTLQKANLYNYNRENYSNTAEYSFFRQSLLEMHRASNAKKFISLDSLEIKLSKSYEENIVEIGILNTQFNSINYNEDNPELGGMNLDTITKKFTLIPDAVPFYTMHTSVIAPLLDAVSGSQVKFRFSTKFFFTNGERVITELDADFGAGIVKKIIANGIFNETEVLVPYEASGTKIINFIIKFNDGSTLKTNGAIYFTTINLNQNITSSCGPIAATDFRQDFIGKQADEVFQGYKPTDPKIKSKIDYRVYYSAGNSQKLIKKPLIIIDGFDPGDKRKIEDCDCELDPVCAAANRVNGVFNSEKHKSIVEIMVYFNNLDEQKLLPILRNKGFDVIIVNFPTYNTTNLLNGQQVAIDGGAYYIESNAMAVIKLLQEVKQQVIANGSTNQTAIIAPSMAGQISRYALSFMEKKFQETNNAVWQHNVSLWVSIDSPHLGANIPLGDQALIYLLKNEDDNANRFYNKELSSPASQQQLIEFHRPKIESHPFNSSVTYANFRKVDSNFLNAQTTSQGLALNRGNSFFQEHYNRQNSNGISGSVGWPQNLRKIAVVNGSLTGSREVQLLNGQTSPYNFADNGASVLNIRGFQRVNIDLPWPLGSITVRTHIASLEANFLGTTGVNGRIARFKKAFDDRTTQAININNRGVMDNVPGGYFDAQRQLYDPISTTLPLDGSSIQIGSFNSYSITNVLYWLSQQLGGSEWQLRDYNPIHSFIPSFSAIAHLEPNQSWTNSLDYNLVCPTNRKTPFDSYFGIAKNTPHTSFTKECVDWLLKELDGQPQLPNYPMEDVTITGPERICLNTNSTYSFADVCKLPSAPSVWSVTPNLQIISQTSYSVTVIGIENGEGTITAIFPNGKRIIKKVYFGSPTIANFEYGNFGTSTSYCIAPAYNYSYSIPELNGTNNVTANFSGLSAAEASLNANWQWKKLNNLIILNGTKNSRNICTLGAGSTSVSVRAHNVCGWSDWVELPFEITEMGPLFDRSNESIYKVFPNPSNNLVNIDLVDSNHFPEATDSISGELFDMIGFSKGTITMVDNKASFSVLGLTPGIYIVKIYINGVPEAHQIAVQ